VSDFASDGLWSWGIVGCAMNVVNKNWCLRLGSGILEGFRQSVAVGIYCTRENINPLS